jgi:hypothetical protein
MADETNQDVTKSSLSVNTGALLTPVYAERLVKTYAIPEHELDSIGLLNNQVALWSSLGTGFMFLVCSCIWDITAAKEELAAASKNVPYLLGGISLACYAFAGLHYISKRNRINKIKQSAGDVTSAARTIVGPSATNFRQLFAVIGVILLLSTIDSGVHALDAASAGNIAKTLLYLAALAAVAMVLWFTRSVD